MKIFNFEFHFCGFGRLAAFFCFKSRLNYLGIKKATNLRDETVMCTQITDNVAKNQFYL